MLIVPCQPKIKWFSKFPHVWPWEHLCRILKYVEVGLIKPISNKNQFALRSLYKISEHRIVFTYLTIFPSPQKYTMVK